MTCARAWSSVRDLVRMRTDVPLDIEAVFKPRVPTVVEDFHGGRRDGRQTRTKTSP